MNDLFSERYGYVSRALQYEYLDKIAKAHLWDEINFYFLSKARYMYEQEGDEYKEDNNCLEHASNFYYSIQRDFWGKSVDDFSDDAVLINSGLKNIVMNTMWYHTLDIIEVVARFSPELIPNTKKRKSRLKQYFLAINKVFEEQNCAYRVVNGLVMPDVNNAEIITIANALTDTNSIRTVSIHLEQAIKHYSDRDNPDYRNAIKESILALEALINLIAGSKSGTMSDALKSIKRKDSLGLHPALHSSLMSLYGWAGDESGVRHYLKEESTIDSDDAKLIIVTCCSFVSYLTAKAVKSGIELK